MRIFSACKYLDYSDNYTAKKAGLSDNYVVWERYDPDGNLQLCQFCKKRGRLNNPQACIQEIHKMCNDYEENKHKVDIKE